jgi:hypothetical protein
MHVALVVISVVCESIDPNALDFLTSFAPCAIVVPVVVALVLVAVLVALVSSRGVVVVAAALCVRDCAAVCAG